MLEQVRELFDLEIDSDLSIMKSNQSLTYITIETLKGLEKEFNDYHPSLVLVQGDTTSHMLRRLPAFIKKYQLLMLKQG